MDIQETRTCYRSGGSYYRNSKMTAWLKRTDCRRNKMDFLIELIANFIGNLIEEILISLPFTNSIVAKRKYRRKNNLFVKNEY